MHIQCLICYCFYPTGWNSKGKNSELSVSLSSPTLSFLGSSPLFPQPVPFQYHGSLPCHLRTDKYKILWAQFPLFCLLPCHPFLSIRYTEQVALPWGIMIAWLLWSGFWRQGAAVGNSIFHMAAGSWASSRWTGDWLMIPGSPSWSLSTRWLRLSLSLMVQATGLLSVDVQ